MYFSFQILISKYVNYEINAYFSNVTFKIYKLRTDLKQICIINKFLQRALKHKA